MPDTERCAACETPTPQDIDAPLCRLHFNRYVAFAMNPERPESDLPYPSCHLIDEDTTPRRNHS